MDIRIRPGTDADAKAVAALHTASWRTAYAGIMPEDYLHGPLEHDHQVVWLTRLTVGLAEGNLFVAESAGDVVGFIYLTPTPDGRILIDNLHVDPTLKRGGIGSRLLHYGFDWAATEYPGRSVYLEVLQANKPAIAFYERHGGRPSAPRIAHFTQGFELPELEITW
ncbi:GNAT family N-acetyltransferase [Nocardia sp. CDC160]|uniref:GNAT family N-acetyltransferase n=1 Tax=Nocardia sp. CDC160 TaxID=3112166 RepID=UPI002DB5D7DA|nr:N-acetyltransferase [Nocardia sp. CDC160]MEC3917751.1 N-acetyltransferase [Nocardia sp. CDC160]